MDLFVSEEDWNAHYPSPAAFAADNECAEGDEFTLVRATVTMATTYRMVGGKPIPVALHMGPELPLG